MEKLIRFCVCLFLFTSYVHGGLVNVARGKKTDQSSTWDNDEGAYSHLAVDGCYDPNYFNTDCGCTHSASGDSDAWWSVNMGIISTVHYVKILNRGDCCSERLANFNIYVATETNDPTSSDVQLCKHYTGAMQDGDNGMETIHCDQPLTGLYLIVELPGNILFTLCEVEVYADDHSHWGTIFNYATFKTVQMTNDQEREGNMISTTLVDNDHSTCPDILNSGTENGKLSIDLGHDVAVSKVRVHQSSSCPYFCSTRLDLQGWGWEDRRPGCNNNNQGCWIVYDGVEYIKVNETDTNNGYRTTHRGWNIIVLDECGCTIKHRMQFDHFSDSQQRGCMDAGGFTPFLRSLDDGDIVIGVSKDEVQRGLANCYLRGLELLNVPTNYNYRDSIAFIAKKGFQESTIYGRVNRPDGPVNIDNVWIGASPLHVFTAGTTSSPLAGSLAQTCGTYNGLVGRAEVAVLECDSDNLPMGRYFQLDFPSYGMHLCEVEIYLGNMLEFCPESSDRCYYVPSRTYSTVAEAAWECTTLYATGRIAVTPSAALSQFVSARDSAGLSIQVMPGMVAQGNQYVYYATNNPVEIGASGISGDFIYINSGGSYAGANNGGGPFYPLCDVSAALYSGSEHVALRVKAYSSNLDGSIYDLWSESSSLPEFDDEHPSGMGSLDVASDVVYKSPLIDCAWDFIKEVRVSFYKRDVEAAFLNFEVSGDSTKETFFSTAALTGSTWTDMFDDPRTVSLSGSTTSGTQRRFLFERTSDNCNAGSSETAWFTVLDTDHTGCTEWDTVTGLPAFIYSDSIENTAESDTDLNSADLLIVKVRLENTAFSGSCIMTCDGKADGQYHSCVGCNVFVTCSSEVASFGVCGTGQVWQSSGATSGQCAGTSTSCTDRAAYPECTPDGCASSPCANSAQCSSGADGGWQCTCVSGWEGTDCSSEVDECASNPCQYGSCIEGFNGYQCDCDAGYEGTHCEINIDECSPNPCQNGGACTDGVNSFTCACVAGYGGSTCESDFDECSSSPCQNDAACSNEVNQYSCTCLPGYVGTNCETDVNECSSNPCQNGATCNDLVNSYTCTCVAGYTGTNCQTNINECASSPCQNGGTCTDGINGFTCACVAGYGGSTCNTDANECDSNPCQNGATCNDEVNQYTCDCVPGYVGTNCETDVNECSSNPCQNGATCNDLVNSYSCTCVAGYEGTNCETDTNECASNPCQNGGTCTDTVNGYSCACVAGYLGDHCATDFGECDSNPCQNDAECVDEVNQFTCNCVAGYVDTLCETDFDECASSPCVNGGTCTDNVNSFSCSCVDGFEGTTCSVNIDECASSPCQNDGTCNDGVNGYTCTCVDGYVGDNCEMDFDDCESIPCQNGGTCTDELGGFTCECPERTMGETCMDNPCLPNPCMYSGTCEANTTNPTQYTPNCVECVPGFSGDLCEIGPCEENPEYCANEGVCSNVIEGEGYEAAAAGSCDCTGTGYEGDFCDEGDGTIGLLAHQTSNNDDKKDKDGIEGFIQNNPTAVIGAVAGLAGLCGILFIVAMRRRKKEKQKVELKEKDKEEDNAEQGQAQNRNTTYTGIGGAGGNANANPWANSTNDFLDY